MCDCTTNEFERPSADSNCTDLDECSDEHNTCTGPFELCHNYLGSFRFDCMANGFGRPSADSNCTDFDECSEKQNACTGPFELCQKKIGSFRCDCMAKGFRRPSADSNCTILMNVPKNKTHALGIRIMSQRFRQFQV